MSISQLLTELSNCDFVIVGFKLFGILAFYVLSLLLFWGTFEFLLDYFEKKRQVKQYLQKHRFDHFRCVPFFNDNFVIVEDVSYNDDPLVIAYVHKGYNADKICDILNCDYLGEVYSPKKATKLFNCSVEWFKGNKNLKSTKSGERKDEK